jgi:hypothetical protein
LQRAADLRRQASETRDFAVKRDLLYIAKQYEQHARSMEQGGAKIDTGSPNNPF